MPIAILILVSGVVLTISAYKGVGLTDLLAGSLGDTLNPHGPDTPDVKAASGASSSQTPSAAKDAAPQHSDKYGFKGPNATLLSSLAGSATGTFNLTITSTDGGTHVPTSWHYKKRAFDAAGKAADMAAFWQYAHDTYGSDLLELFYDPKGAIKNGASIPAVGGHSDHVHVAA